MAHDQRGLCRAINAASRLAILLPVVAQQIFPRDLENVPLGSHLAAEPELAGRRDEEIFIARDAGPFDRFLSQHLLLVSEKVPARVNLLAAALQFLLVLEKAEQRLACTCIAQGTVVHEIVVDHAGMDRDAQVEASVYHLSHLIERLFEKDATYVQLDLRIFEPVELVHDRLHRFACARDRRHPVHGNLQVIEARSFKVRQELAVQEKPVCGHAHFAKTEGSCVTHYLHNVRMLERFAPLQADAYDAELPNVVHPLLEVGQGRMWNRVVELVAIMAIQIALFSYVQVRSPRFGVKNATDLLEIEHSFSYHSHRRGVKQLG